jgi:hypothetical protein
MTTELTDSDRASLQKLLDKEACRDVLSQYGSSLDWLDEELFTSLFWPDGEIDFGFLKAPPPELIPPIMEMERQGIGVYHLMVADRLRVDGDTALAEGYGLTIGASREAGVPDDDRPVGAFYGRYLFSLEKRDGEWRIRSLRYLMHGGHEWAPRMPAGLQLTRFEPSPDDPFNTTFKGLPA